MGHAARIERIKGKPQMGYVEIYESNIFISPPNTNQLGPARRLGTSCFLGGTCQTVIAPTGDGCYCADSLLAGSELVATVETVVEIVGGILFIFVVPGRGRRSAPTGRGRRQRRRSLTQKAVADAADDLTGGREVHVPARSEVLFAGVVRRFAVHANRFTELRIHAFRARLGIDGALAVVGDGLSGLAEQQRRVLGVRALAEAFQLRVAKAGCATAACEAKPGECGTNHGTRNCTHELIR
jgi:hypothetical protein